MLDGWDWSQFTTNTFRHDVHPEKANRLWRVWISIMNRRLYGHRWWKHGKGLYWCRVTELQQRGAIHFHGLLGGDRADTLDSSRWAAEWFRLAGIARMEKPNSKDAVQNYVTKYIVRGGEIDFGGPLMLTQRSLR